MKIALVNKFFFINGGQETVALEQMRLLEQAGHEVAFFSMHHPRNPPDYYWSKYFVNYVDFSLRDSRPGLLEKLNLSSKFIYNAEAARRFAGFLEEFRPDVIHCHGIAHQLTYSILREANKRGIPVVQTLHDYQAICPSYTLLTGEGRLCESGCDQGNYLPCIHNRCVKQSFGASVLSSMEMFLNRTLVDYTRWVDCFISPSRFLAERIVRAGVPDSKVMHLRNFLLNVENVVPSEEDERYFLYIGRLSHEKGLQTLLRAFYSVPEAKLRIAGDGAMRESLENSRRELNLGNIEFLGHVERTEIDALIAKASAVILPSEWYENQPMSIIEAFARGKPVIASDIGGIPEMVTDGRNGYLFPSGNALVLAEVIRKADTDRGRLMQLGRNARMDALKGYAADQHLEKLISCYQRLTSHKSGVRPC